MLLRRLGLEGFRTGAGVAPALDQGIPNLRFASRLKPVVTVKRLLLAIGAIAAMLVLQGDYLSALPASAYGLPKPDISGYAPVNGIQMWYAVFNPNGGDPVLLLHGGLGSSRDWRNQVPALVGKHKVIVADSRGQGRSTMSSAPISYDLMSSDVLGLMDYLNVDRAAIVGWSDGGIIGLDIAMSHPERLTKLFAYGANYNVDGLIPPNYPHIRLPIPTAQPVGPQMRVVHEVNRMWNTEPNFQPEQLATITTPTVIADGEDEEVIKPEHTVELAKLVPGAELVVLPNVGHGGLLTDPPAFNRAMTSFLDAPMVAATN